MLSERRELAAARRFFKQAIGTNGVPDRVIIYKSGANLAGLMAMNVIMKFTGAGQIVTIRKKQFPANGISAFQQFAALAA